MMANTHTNGPSKGKSGNGKSGMKPLNLHRQPRRSAEQMLESKIARENQLAEKARKRAEKLERQREQALKRAQEATERAEQIRRENDEKQRQLAEADTVANQQLTQANAPAPTAEPAAPVQQPTTPDAGTVEAGAPAAPAAPAPAPTGEQPATPAPQPLQVADTQQPAPAPAPAPAATPVPHPTPAAAQASQYTADVSEAALIKKLSHDFKQFANYVRDAYGVRFTYEGPNLVKRGFISVKMKGELAPRRQTIEKTTSPTSVAREAVRFIQFHKEVGLTPDYLNREVRLKDDPATYMVTGLRGKAHAIVLRKVGTEEAFTMSPNDFKLALAA
jgi:hypothetical protein